VDLQKQVDQHEKRMLRIEKQLDATAKLVRAGMKMVIEDRKAQKETNRSQNEANGIFNYKLNALIESQQDTERKLKRLIDVLLRNNPNGRSS
jgi:hypothetical protein